MSRLIATKRLGYEALRRLDNPRYRARRDFVISWRRLSDMSDQYAFSPRLHAGSDAYSEAAAGIEPAYKGFAGLGLPTWLRRLKTPARQKAKPAIRSESDSGFRWEALFSDDLSLPQIRLRAPRAETRTGTGATTIATCHLKFVVCHCQKSSEVDAQFPAGLFFLRMLSRVLHHP